MTFTPLCAEQSIGWLMVIVAGWTCAMAVIIVAAVYCAPTLVHAASDTFHAWFPDEEPVPPVDLQQQRTAQIVALRLLADRERQREAFLTATRVH